MADGRGVPAVVIIGAGFAGLEAAKVFDGVDVLVTIVDRNNYHKFQPLLYEVAMAGLEADDIAHNVRDIFRKQRNVRFRMGEVVAVRREEKAVVLSDGTMLPYDYLIVCAGAVTNFFNVPGAEEHAFPLKNISDAIRLRNHVLKQFERYDQDSEEVGEGALTFVLVGGGPTGVEMSGALVELFATLEDDFPDLAITDLAQVVLVEMQDSLLPPYHEELRAYTRKTLERRGVDVRTGTAVAHVEPTAVELQCGDRIATQTLIWAAGVRAHPLADTLRAEQTPDGRLVVDSMLSLSSDPYVFAVGDIAASSDSEGNEHPGVAQVAIQQGRHAAKQILSDLAGSEREPFEYRDYGQMATIGRNAAVGEFPGGIKIRGFTAWFIWVFIHIAKIVGFRNRASAFVNWAYNYFTYQRSARLILELPGGEQVIRDAFEGHSGDGATSEPVHQA